MDHLRNQICQAITLKLKHKSGTKLSFSRAKLPELFSSACTRRWEYKLKELSWRLFNAPLTFLMMQLFQCWATLCRKDNVSNLQTVTSTNCQIGNLQSQMHSTLSTGIVDNKSCGLIPLPIFFITLQQMVIFEQKVSFYLEELKLSNSILDKSSLRQSAILTIRQIVKTTNGSYDKLSFRQILLRPFSSECSSRWKLVPRDSSDAPKLKFNDAAIFDSVFLKSFSWVTFKFKLTSYDGKLRMGLVAMASSNEPIKFYLGYWNCERNLHWFHLSSNIIECGRRIV